MKEKIMLLTIGILVGAVLATGAFYIYTLTTDSNSCDSIGMEMNGGTPPEMPNGGQMPDGQPPEMPNGGQMPDGQPPEKPNGDNAQPPAKPGENNTQDSNKKNN